VGTLTADAFVGSGDHLVVVVAHPDDESFGCGSLIAAASATGAGVSIICATRGEAGERVGSPDTDGVPLGVVRERELRAAGRVLGVAAIDLLDHADSGFDGPLPDGALCGVGADALAAELESRLKRDPPDVVLILDGSDGHRDHLQIRAAVESVVQRGERRPRLVQSCLANGLMRRWVDEMKALNPDAALLDLDVDQLGRPDAELTSIDSRRYVSIREEAIACHRSQRSPFEGLSPDLRRAFLATDFVIVIHGAA
jgi:N-acetyl-1-D-myo-inositol-2-amino-2-deoxy-alpha-D-glucopyranoside deacetylase